MLGGRFMTAHPCLYKRGEYMARPKSATSVRSVAETLGVGRETVYKKRKSMGITGESTEAEAEMVAEQIGTTERIRRRNKDVVEGLTSKTYRSKVRRIDKKNASVTRELLQDAKERYVANERIIERLQFEVDQQEIYTVDNANGSMSTIPQLQTMQNYIKLNITLRTQILALEQALEISAEEESDPFA